jgi:hypothetical protein
MESILSKPVLRSVLISPSHEIVTKTDTKLQTSRKMRHRKTKTEMELEF